MGPFLLYYGIDISLLSLFLTVYDKVAATKRPRHRIREKTLLIVGFLGGATAMWLTMLLIRHKTRKPKFMILLPLFILLHFVLITLYLSGGIP